MARTGSWYWIICIVALLSLTVPSIPMVSSARLAEADPQVNVAGESTLEKKSLSRFYDPVEIRAEILADLLGTRLSELRLYSYYNGSLHQVLFQFDEWTEEGSMILDRGGEANTDLGNGVLDRSDMLVFKARDSGDRVSKELWPSGATRGLELEIFDPLTDGK